MHKISRISLAFTGAILSASLLAACGEDNPTNAFDKFMSSSSTTQSDPLSSVTPPGSSNDNQDPTSSAEATSSSRLTRLALKRQSQPSPSIPSASPISATCSRAYAATKRLFL